MDIRDTRAMKDFAGQQLGKARDSRKITVIFAGIVIAVSLLVTVVSYVLNLQLSHAGGLSNLGTRSILSTVQTILPAALSLLMMCLELGYVAAMLRISRGQYASAQTLRAGFERFGPLLRTMLLQSLIYLAIGFVCTYLATQIFLLTPLSKDAMKILVPLVTEAASSGSTILSGNAAAANPLLLMDDATYLQLMNAMTPALIITAVLFLPISAPVIYQYRMTPYILLDRPGCGAIYAMRESRRMMKGNRWNLFRLDLSMWWYYALSVAALLLCNADQLLPLVGITLPMPEAVSYFGFYALFLAMEFGIYYLMRSQVEVTYALAYDAIRPQEKKESGVVLGNIFNL